MEIRDDGQFEGFEVDREDDGSITITRHDRFGPPKAVLDMTREQARKLIACLQKIVDETVK